MPLKLSTGKKCLALVANSFAVERQLQNTSCAPRQVLTARVVRIGRLLGTHDARTACLPRFPQGRAIAARREEWGRRISRRVPRREERGRRPSRRVPRREERGRRPSRRVPRREERGRRHTHEKYVSVARATRPRLRPRPRRSKPSSSRRARRRRRRKRTRTRRRGRRCARHCATPGALSPQWAPGRTRR